MKGNKGNRPYLIPEGIKDGDIFGEVEIVRFAGRNQRYQARFVVKCVCGSEFETLGTNLKSGNTTHCNAGHHRALHGMVDTPEYVSWKAMNWRVKSSHPHVAPHYMNRGITVCKEWRDSFTAFLSHIGKMPLPKMTVDRIDNAGGYEPGNVRWATQEQQKRNTSRNRLLSIAGVTKTLIEWSDDTGLDVSTIAYRVKRKWPESELLSLRKGKHRVGRLCA